MFLNNRHLSFSLFAYERHTTHIRDDRPTGHRRETILNLNNRTFLRVSAKMVCLIALLFAYLRYFLYLCTQIIAVMKKVLNIREPNVYARHLEADVIHPQISVVHFDELEKGVRTSLNSYSVYGCLFNGSFRRTCRMACGLCR